MPSKLYDSFKAATIAYLAALRPQPLAPTRDQYFLFGLSILGRLPQPAAGPNRPRQRHQPRNEQLC